MSDNRKANYDFTEPNNTNVVATILFVFAFVFVSFIAIFLIFQGFKSNEIKQKQKSEVSYNLQRQKEYTAPFLKDIEEKKRKILKKYNKN